MNKHKPAAPLNILLAIDGSKHSAAAVTLTVDIGWPAGTSARVLAVVAKRFPPNIDLSPEVQHAIEEALANICREDWTTAEVLTTLAADRLRANDLPAEVEICEGRPAEMILERTATLAIDLIVIDARGLSAPGESRLGSTAHKLAYYADCSVLVARPLKQTGSLRTILAADGSLEAQRAAEILCVLSPSRWTALTVVSVAEANVDNPSGTDKAGHRPIADLPEAIRRIYLEDAARHARELVNYLHNCGIQARTTIRCGHPADEILTAARDQDADLIVVGARGQTRSEPLRLGGVAQKVVKFASCSVLVVR
jgi:nucleotide-binding universal stress UspA family protein